LWLEIFVTGKKELFLQFILAIFIKTQCDNVVFEFNVIALELIESQIE